MFDERLVSMKKGLQHPCKRNFKFEQLDKGTNRPNDGHYRKKYLFYEL